jgi:cation:H+ antiporter
LAVHFILFTILGLLGVVASSDIIVNSAQKIARNLRISELVIGLTVTAIGTNLPEIFTTVVSAWNNLNGIESSGIAVGNIVGSCIANITIMLGICGIFSIFVFRRESLYRDCVAMFLATAFVIVLSLDGRLEPIEGVIMVMIYCGYILFMLEREKISKTEVEYPKSNTILNLIIIAVGIAALLLFAKVMVDYGIKVADWVGVPETLVGILIGLGTSVPELSVSLIAIIKKSGMLSIGNLIGSNISDTLFALGIGAAISGFNVAKSIVLFDMVFWVASTVIVMLLLFNHLNLNSKESSILVILYLIYIYLKLIYAL